MEKLNQYSLMVGDWVRNDLGEIQQVVELREAGAMLAYNDIYPYDAIEPIPITPAILEKNGFSQARANGHIFIFQEKSGEVIYYEYGPKYGLTIDNQLATIQDLKIRYIHELQHCLKLCGIDKTIEL